MIPLLVLNEGINGTYFISSWGIVNELIHVKHLEQCLVVVSTVTVTITILQTRGSKYILEVGAKKYKCKLKGKQ